MVSTATIVYEHYSILPAHGSEMCHSFPKEVCILINLRMFKKSEKQSNPDENT